ncbi:hypothetical protein VTN00DRAFT_6903 [Thermoascus crustaceus]|uniref:uncharacterized protein n=1 Tax=Thermoascus crustaceus TaxID=5088 RepID=UPI0037438334
MAGPDDKSSSIPEWQQQASSATPDESSASAQSSEEAPDTASRDTLLEQATRFLQDESIRDAPTDRKIAFLESKGLKGDEIQKLLGVSRNAEATSQEGDQREDEAMSSTSSDASSEALVETPSSSSTSSSENIPTPTSSSASSTTTTKTARDVPPVITYPEFLLQPANPPPLFSFRSILYTLYGAAGLGASVYGMSEYLVKPMLSSLTNARHELAQTAQQNLRKLNDKLEQNVSVIPPYPSRAAAAKANASDTDDSDSVTSDPTELFHRDIATQTTPDLARGVSTPSYFTNADAEKDSTKTALGHAKRLDILRSHLREFLEAESQAGVADDLVKDRLGELQTYLDSLTYSGSSYLSSSIYNIYSATGAADLGGSSVVGAMTGMRKGEEDAINSFKAEIRGVKGALLSARNFPAGRGGRIVAGVGR